MQIQYGVHMHNLFCNLICKIVRAMIIRQTITDKTIDSIEYNSGYKTWTVKKYYCNTIIKIAIYIFIIRDWLQYILAEIW